MALAAEAASAILLLLKMCERFREVLHELDGAEVCAIIVVDSMIAHADGFACDAAPNGHVVASLCFEVGEQVLHDWHDLCRVAVVDGAAKRELRPGEDLAFILEKA